MRVPELTVISWRDIPAQVTAGKGRGALDAEVAPVAAQLEHEYTDERLERLVRASGEEERA